MLPVAKRKSRRGPAPGHFLRKVCKKAKGTRGTANSASSGTLRSWVQAASYAFLNWKTHVFEKKTRFFHKTFPWLSRGRRPLRVPLMMQLSMRTVSWVFTFASYTFFHFLSCLGVLCSEETPERVFCHFFRKRFRTRACTDLQCTFAQKCFFLQRKKSAFKRSYRVRGMGPPPGTRLCMYSYQI